jgi:AAA+ ATPase superfamily predicted ATPase
MIGREREKSILLSLVNEEEPQFIAVFGRRRIGKTHLVREGLSSTLTFYVRMKGALIRPQLSTKSAGLC